MWTAPKVAHWVKAHTGKTMAEITAGPTCDGWVSPSKAPVPATPAPRRRRSRRRSKKVAEVVEEQRRLYPQGERAVEVWVQDETRLGLKPIVRRVWARKGQRPLAFHRTRDEWLYVYLFVHPASGQSAFLILPTVNSELMSLALREFQRGVDPEGRKVLVLLLDNAGWHRAKDLQVPPGGSAPAPAALHPGALPGGAGGAFAAGSGGQ